MTDPIPDPQVPKRSRGRHQSSAKYNPRIPDEYDASDKAGKGALQRGEGPFTPLISEWRGQRNRGALEALDRRPSRAQDFAGSQELDRPSSSSVVCVGSVQEYRPDR